MRCDELSCGQARDWYTNTRTHRITDADHMTIPEGQNWPGVKTHCLICWAMCSRNLHWPWINWTLLCNTMEVSMLCLAWLVIAQHVYQPALTGRLESTSQKIASCDREQRLSWWAYLAQNCLPWCGGQGVTAIWQKISCTWVPKSGVQHATAIYPIPWYTRPLYIGSILYIVTQYNKVLNIMGKFKFW